MDRQREDFLRADLGTQKLISYNPMHNYKGAVIKYGTEGDGRDLTGSPELSDGKCWANKLLQRINMGHEAICLWICFQCFQLF